MKYFFFSVVTFLFFIQANSQEVSLMTYNIRLDVASDGENAWPNRKEMLLSQLNYFEPDIFGIQEGMPHQVNYINEELQSYNFVGQGRDGGKKGEYSALFYNNTKFNLKESGTFWLSESPEIVSKGWDAAYPRVCTYGLFKGKKSGKRFWVFNTHLDHLGMQAREEGVKLILSEMKRLNKRNYTVVFMGDFNLVPKSEPILSVLETMNDSKNVSGLKPFGPEGTFNGFNYFESQNRRIDYIFVSKKSSVKKYAVLNNSYNLKYPSDHFPVFVELSLN
jgi:endonuclease/exonuclease/phosphatase family metal-dependent hydrolase